MSTTTKPRSVSWWVNAPEDQFYAKAREIAEERKRTELPNVQKMNTAGRPSSTQLKVSD